MSDSQIRVTISDESGKRVLSLRSDAWPLRIGSDPKCNIVLSDARISAENALIERMGAHNYVQACPGAPVRARDEEVPVGSSVRFDHTEIRVGRFGITVEY